MTTKKNNIQKKTNEVKNNPTTKKEKVTNLFTSNLTGKMLITEKSLTKKAVNAALADYFRAIDGAFTAVIKSDDIRARNVANAAKGKFGTSLQVVASCYPWQTEEGVLCTKKKDDNGVKVWHEKALTAAAARGIVREALKNFTNSIGAPDVQRVTLGAMVE